MCLVLKKHVFSVLHMVFMWKEWPNRTVGMVATVGGPICGLQLLCCFLEMGPFAHHFWWAQNISWARRDANSDLVGLGDVIITDVNIGGNRLSWKMKRDGWQHSDLHPESWWSKNYRMPPSLPWLSLVFWPRHVWFYREKWVKHPAAAHVLGWPDSNCHLTFLCRLGDSWAKKCRPKKPLETRSYI